MGPPSYQPPPVNSPEPARVLPQVQHRDDSSSCKHMFFRIMLFVILVRLIRCMSKT